MYYDVFIPSAEDDGYDVTITVDATNWMSALKSGLERTGEGPDAIRNVMCDIKEDNTIHVTDASTQRVFVLHEISEEEYKKSLEGSDEPDEPEAVDSVDAIDDADTIVDLQQEAVRDEPVAEDVPSRHEAVAPEPLAPEPEAVAPEPAADHAFVSGDGNVRIGSSTSDELKRQDQGQDAQVVRETRRKADRGSTGKIGRVEEKISENLIEDVFLEIQEIHEGDKNMEEVVNFCMDMAMEKMRAESGSILFADVNGRELYFATARGPKSDEIMDFRVQMSQGIVGFCAREGVSLALSDVERDPRFYRDISDAIGYETRNLLCAPIQHENRVYGCLELLNKERSSSFSSNEMNALSYISRQLGKFVYNQIMAAEKLAHEK